MLERALAAKDLTPPIESGILLYRATRFTRDATAARADIDRSIRLHPYAEAWLERAHERLRQEPIRSEDLEEIVKCCDWALDSPAYNRETYEVAKTHYLRGSALVKLGRQGEAADSVERYLANGGKPSAEIHRLRGLIKLDRHDFASAFGALSDSLALDPNNVDTLAERGSVYLLIGALDLALDDFQAALKRDKDNANALAGRGMVRAFRGDDDGAEDDAERAWAVGPRTQRLAWMAARTLAVVHGRLQSRGRFVSVEESKNMVRYRNRTLALLEQALLLTPPDQQAAFWRDTVEADTWLSLLQDQPKFGELGQNYGRPAAEPKREL